MPDQSAPIANAHLIITKYAKTIVVPANHVCLKRMHCISNSEVNMSAAMLAWIGNKGENVMPNVTNQHATAVNVNARLVVWQMVSVIPLLF